MIFASTIARHWPFANGSGRFIDRFAGEVDCGEGEVTVVTSDQVEITVLADDHIGRHILLSGQFDRTICSLLVEHSRPGDVLIDVGANIGYVSSCFLANVADSRVIAVEPQPGITDILRRNLAQFGDRARIEPVALSETRGEVRFSVNSANRGASRIDRGGEVVVPTLPASEILHGVKRLDAVKIDVEGHEEPVFRSLAQDLARLRPHTILFECTTASPAPGGVIGDLLAGLGYRVFGIDKRLFATRLLEIGDPETCRFNDYIARPV